MNTEFISKMDVYWITRLDYIHNLGVTFIATSILFLVFGTLIMFANEWKYKFIQHFMNTIASIVLLLGIATVTFVPSTKEMIVIQVVPKIANSDFIQKDLPKEAKEMYSVAKSYLKEKLGTKKKDGEEEQ